MIDVNIKKSGGNLMNPQDLGDMNIYPRTKGFMSSRFKIVSACTVVVGGLCLMFRGATELFCDKNIKTGGNNRRGRR